MSTPAQNHPANNSGPVNSEPAPSLQEKSSFQWLWLGTSFLFLAIMALLLWFLVDLPRLDWLIPGISRKSPGTNTVLLQLTLANWLLFALATATGSRALRGVSAKASTVIVLTGMILLGVVAMSAPPATSNDSARYAWDGIVQKTGTSPYKYPPNAMELRDLQPGWLMQPEPENGVCDPVKFPSGAEVDSGQCWAINRPAVPTIYPPASEIFFFLVRLPLNSEVQFFGFQLAFFFVCLAVTLGLLRIFWKQPSLRHRTLWWAWSPYIALEAINNAHVDVLGAALVLLAVVWLARKKVTQSAIAFGVAVSTKLIPVIAAPGMLYRKPLRFIAIAIASFGLLYLPYIFLSGISVLGYLPMYLNEEGYDSELETQRFALLKMILPPQWAALSSIALLAILAILIWWRTKPDRPWDGQALFIAFTLLLVSPNYSWYSLLLVPFVILSGRWEYFVVTIALVAMSLMISSPQATMISRSVLITALTVVLSSFIWRHYREKIPESPRFASSKTRT